MIRAALPASTSPKPATRTAAKTAKPAARAHQAFKGAFEKELSNQHERQHGENEAAYAPTEVATPALKMLPMRLALPETGETGADSKAAAAPAHHVQTANPTENFSAAPEMALAVRMGNAAQNHTQAPVSTTAAANIPAKPEETAVPAAPPVERKLTGSIEPEAKASSPVVVSGHEFAADTKIDAPQPPTRVQQIEEPVAPTPAPHSAVKEISVRVGEAGQPAAVIRVQDRAGEVRVAVHAAEPRLANEVRTNAPELKQQLETRGWNTEVWATRESAPAQHDHPGSSQGDPQFRQPQERREQRGKRPKWVAELQTSQINLGAQS